jgi:hypothetical protein
VRYALARRAKDIGQAKLDLLAGGKQLPAVSAGQAVEEQIGALYPYDADHCISSVRA